ncbi:MAG: lipopolysaccharide biosynthesis protein [Spirochaetia bacterium]|nr:lipopolysaccharide biosynthesis protein [Spirochaetia bacterium]
MSCDLTNKRVLMFAPKFFGYEKEIANKLKQFGAEVDLYDERANSSTWGKIFIRLQFFFPVKKKIKEYYHNVIANNKNYDYVIFINPETVTVDFLKQMRGKFTNAKFILYVWDSLENKPHVKTIISLFDRKYSFNKDDCKKYDFLFRPLFFSDSYDLKNVTTVHEQKYDIVFVGTIHSDRYFILEKIKTWAVDNGLKVYFFMYFPSRVLYFKHKISNLRKGIKKSDFSFVSKSPNEIKDLFLASNVIVDIQHPNQTGLTMRTMETLGLEKKLITTNSDIKQYDFYNPQNVYVIDRKQPVINKEFIKEPYVKINEGIRQKYSLNGFIEEIITEIM